MSAWDLPYLVLLVAGLWALVTDGRGLAPVERTLGCFGIGGIGAARALFDLFAVAALGGLAFHAAAERRFGGVGPALFALGLASALGLGLAAVWLRARLGRRPPDPES